ncbi:MAG TPA: TIGR03000 domain-containing protein [Gemmataceae bacterium]|jgi:uncharacterized protein (TIGR03000 family)|nr:TIGR03000 domain-containing protein [Gemmataceae bacterium]
MYSAVLLLALSAPAEQPSFHGCGACGGGAPAFAERAAIAFFRLVVVLPLRLGTFPARALLYPLTGRLRYFPIGAGGGSWGGRMGCGPYGYGGLPYDGANPYFAPPGNPPVAPPNPNLLPPAKRSQIEIKMPDSARLFVDGVPAPKPALEFEGVKTFQSPDLPADTTQVYTFAIEFEKDGQMIQKTQTIRFRAGEPVKVDFTDAAAVTQK